ncbi:structural maintenance of chromosomes flexible hinge domain-containing protein GMI1 isoform X2 [Vicia villosa]|uniref:structural maintenance of chromosomes flexible hinge domain-containing protein GMI1 isoform X2 n=1 Tax=Vicia villosa TaxID=3911 RepID=UPI00273A8F1E|nr:structural maintenance of chromosomes flexible hinge domain-containing protein GMI1 isoform X2 [Vicia villosa]
MHISGGMERAMVVTNPKKRKLAITEDDDDDIGIRKRVFRFKVLLPNGTSVELKVPSAENEMHVGEFVGLVRKKYLELKSKFEWMKKKRDINWKGSGLYLEDAGDNKIRNVIEFKNFAPRKCHILRLNDGSSDVAHTFENMWDLTPDIDLLLELPEEYDFEAAIADLIDNALQAVWSNGKNNRKLVRVNVTDEKISIFDSGTGMDDSDENSLVKWGKMGASIHRLSKSLAIGGNPPYLLPYFGMFGYGGPVASMHLGRRTRVSSKTKQVKKVYTLLLQREALLSRSHPEATWKTNGGIRDPLKDEISNSDGSFTKVDIIEPKEKGVDINNLRCRLKDIYFPYIQNDDLSARGKTITPIEFQINGVDLTEIQGGEVATTNLHSCNGPEFVLQLHLSIKDDHDGTRGFNEANARLRFVYFPFTEGKESIEKILEKLTADGYIIRENFQDFSRVSIRRLGRLLPDARWTFLPFMDFRNKRLSGSRGSILKRCSLRVKCFVETDAGFKPTQSKTDLAHHNHFTVALKNLGSKISDKETAVSVEISTGTKMVTPAQLEKEYQEWIIKMHNQYDEEADATAEDNPVIIVSPPNKKALGISKEVVRVHHILKRKEKSWTHGQRIKVLKGACPGISNNVYATIDCFLLEGFEGDPGGEARIMCRPIDIPAEKGCYLDDNEVDPTLNVGSSLSLPITVIDTEKLVTVGDVEWENRLNKIQQKSPACFDTPNPNRYKRQQVGEVDSISKSFDKRVTGIPSHGAQKYELLTDDQSKSFDKRVTGKPSHGAEKYALLTDDQSKSFDKRVTGKPSHCAEKYELLTDDQSPELEVRAGYNFPTLSIAYYDIHGNRVPFQTTPDVAIQLQAAENLYFEVHGMKIGLSTDNMILKIMDAMVTSNELDKIRPSYRTTLIITSKQFPLSLTVPCRVFPSYPKHVILKPEIREDQLLPGFICKELMLEMFDTYRNHVSEGMKVDIVVAGFEMLNHCSTSYKVDDKGKINLSGLLKLTAGYGEIASISVVFQNTSIFKQEFSIARRSLRIASKVPDICAAGGQLENIEFEVINIDGEVDTKIHHDDQHCQFHMLTIKSDFFSAEESIRYTFKHGRCTIPSINVPEIEGTFSFEASHTQYAGLCRDVEVEVIRMSNVKDATQLPPDKNILPPQELTPLYPENNLMISILNNDSKKLEKIFRLGEKIKQVEECLEDSLKQKDEIEKDMLMLQDNFQHYQLDYVDSRFTNTKEEMATKIKNMENSAASVLCSLTTDKKQRNIFLEDIIGVVALLGSVQSPELSRILAEYVGEEKMLGVICKSFNTAISLEKYKHNGEIDHEHALHAEAAALGKAISNRFFVMCFENIRPYNSIDRPHNGSWHDNNSQRKLFLPDPKMPNGKTPAGFIGYAVNMIDLDTHHLQTRTTSGYGLRETVLFSLFKKLHVYKTRENMVDALPCIEEGAVSLDGGIIREHGTLSLGYGIPSICFPCTYKTDISPEAKEILTQIEEKQEQLLIIEGNFKKATKHHQKYLQKFKDKEKKYNNLMDTIKTEKFEQRPLVD